MTVVFHYFIVFFSSFPDVAVRELAAEIADGMSDDELIRVLPQLAQALRYETYEASPLAGKKKK